MKEFITHGGKVKSIFLSSVMALSLSTFASFDIENPEHQVPFEQTKSLEALGGWSSGGGNAIVCFRQDHTGEYPSLEPHMRIPDHMLNQIESIEMYDLYSAKLPRGFDQMIPEIMEISSDEKIYSYINRVIKRYKNYIPAVRKHIRTGIDNFTPRRVRFHNTPIKQVQDVNETGVINNEKCTFTTVAIQRSWRNHHELHIDARLFNHQAHSRQSKATLVLHEYIYLYDRIHIDSTDSSRTRKYVEELISFYYSQGVLETIELLYQFEFIDRESVLRHTNLSTHTNKIYFMTHTLIGQLYTKAVTDTLVEVKKELTPLGFPAFEAALKLLRKNQYGSDFNYFSVLNDLMSISPDDERYPEVGEILLSLVNIESKIKEGAVNLFARKLEDKLESNRFYDFLIGYYNFEIIEYFQMLIPFTKSGIEDLIMNNKPIEIKDEIDQIIHQTWANHIVGDYKQLRELAVFIGFFNNTVLGHRNFNISVPFFE